MRALGLAFAASIVAATWAAAPGCTIDSVSESGKPCLCDDDAGYICDRYDNDGGLCRMPYACEGGHQKDCGGGACADLDTDPGNCGDCGIKCTATRPSYSACEQGACVIGACGFQTQVPVDGGDAGCERHASSPEGCGSKDNACPDHFSCGPPRGSSMRLPKSLCFCHGFACGDAGTCRDAGPEDGGGRCECGGHVCAIGETCGANGCSCNDGPPCSGSPSTVCCAAGCADLTHDPENCLACGAKCPHGFKCAFEGDLLETLNALEMTIDTPCKCQEVDENGEHPCQASKGAIAACDEDKGVCLCGRDKTPCLLGQRCTTGAPGGCL